MNELAPPLIQHEIDTQVFKREWCNACARPDRSCWPESVLATGIQSRLPQTLLHGDTHWATRTYLAGGSELLDWQLSVRGGSHA